LKNMFPKIYAKYPDNIWHERQNIR
jgi:hypothetical protein